MNLRQVAGLVVAGGSSTRFGSEKAAAKFRGAPLVELVARAFADLPRHAISARPGSEAHKHACAAGLQVLHDHADHPAGPLAGLAAGLDWARREGFTLLATAPCDAPLLPSDLVLRLAAGIGANSAAYAVTVEGAHPLCALWRVQLADALNVRLRSGQHPAVRAFLSEIGAAAVRFDDADAFANANTPEALAALEAGA
jgi:molybdopterin-guanine dinucleotide biosynthesis protein A